MASRGPSTFPHMAWGWLQGWGGARVLGGSQGRGFSRAVEQAGKGETGGEQLRLLQ